LELKVESLSQEVEDLRKTQALMVQQLRQLDRVHQTTYLLQENLEKLSLELEQIKGEIEGIKTRLKILEAAVFSPPPKKEGWERKEEGEQRKIEEGKKSGEEKEKISDPRTLYQSAYQAFQAGDLNNARSGFQALLQNFPESDLADNALFWLGEIALKENDLEKAKTFFQGVVDRYPLGNKVPDALYKLGVIEKERGNLSQAQGYFQKVIQEYPWSPVADKAKERMKEIRP
jgi:tol-pal system protein YbgF